MNALRGERESGGRVEELIQRLDEAETVLEALEEGREDLAAYTMAALPGLLRQVRVELRESQEWERKLQAVHDELEGQVRRRTEELAQANEELHVYTEELQLQQQELREQNEALLLARREAEIQRQHYQELFEFAPDGYLELDPQGLILQANRAAAELLRVRPDHLAGKPLSVFLEGENLSLFYDQIDQIKNGNHVERLVSELHLKPRGGDSVPVSVTLAPARDPGGQMVGLRCLLRDISERVQAQKERDRLIAILEATPDMVSTADPDGRVLYFNKAARRTLGVPDDVDVLDLNWTIPQGHPEWASALIQQEGLPASERGGMWQGRSAVLDREGREIPMSQVIIAHRGPDGRTEYLSTIARDVSELERLIEENRTQRDFLQRLMDVAPVGIALVRGPERRYEYVNPYYQAIPGVTDVPMVGRTVAEVFPEVAAAGALEGLDEVYRTGQMVSLRECQAWVGPDRGETYWDVDYVPLNGGDGRVDGVLIIAHEVTREVLARRQIEELAARDEVILHSMHEALVIFDLDRHVVEMNPASLRFHGFTSVQETRQHLEDYSPLFELRELEGDLIPAEEWPIGRVLRGESFSNYEVRVRRTDTGQVRFGNYSGVRVQNKDGKEILGILTIRDVTSQKEAEAERERLWQELEAEQARLKTLIEHAPVGIILTDEESRILLANPVAAVLYDRPVPYGEKFQPGLGLTILKSDGTPFTPAEYPIIRSAQEGEICRNVEMRMIWPNEQRRDVLISSAPIRDRADRIAGAVAVFQDITERNMAQEALRRYAGRLQVLHQLDQSILAASSAGEIAGLVLSYLRQMLPTRRASITLFDFKAGEMQVLADYGEGVSLQGEIIPLQAHWPLEALERGEINTTGDVTAALLPAPITQLLLDQGVRYYAHVPLRVQGRLIGSLNLGMEAASQLSAEQVEIAHEVADELAIGIQQARLYGQVRQHAEDLEALVAARTAALQASEAHLRVIFNGSALGISATDLGGRLMESNPALGAMLGYSAEELRGMHFSQFTHPEDVAADGDLFREVAAGRLEGYTMEKRYVRKNGEIMWGHLTISLVRGVDGEPRFAIAMVDDINRQKQTQAALIQSEKLAAAGRLAASLAHEINNPLQSVIGCLGLAREALDEGGDIRRYLGVANDELRRTARIVGQLRNLHQPARPIAREPVDLNELLGGIMELNQHRCNKERVELVWRAAEGLPQLEVVSDQIQQVFLNLLLNAVDAMTGDGGRLEISVEPTAQPAGVRVTFRDSGPGIPPEILPHIFDAFYSTREEGLGLGLFVSQMVVQEHGGHIEVESQAGQGATFRVWLPAEE